MEPEVRLQNLIDGHLEGLATEEPSNVEHDLRAVIKDIAQLRTNLATAEKKRDLAIAHDTQPYPTADAYEKVCAIKKRYKEALRALQKLSTKDSDAYKYIEQVLKGYPK